MIDHWKNLSLENIIEEVDGIVYIEEWKDIEGFEGVYQVSSFGRVKSLRRRVSGRSNKTIILRQHLNKNTGYLGVAISKESKLKTFDVHRAVAKYYLPNPNNLPEVNHKKGIKTDNRSIMLEWSTSSDNAKHKFALGLQTPPWKGKTGKDHPLSRPVIQYGMNSEFIKKWDCLADIYRAFGFDMSAISACCSKRKRFVNGVAHTRKSAYGFIWKHA